VAKNSTRRVGTIRAEKLVTASYAAGILGITTPYFAKLITDGIFKKAKHDDGAFVTGRYDLASTVQAYIAFLTDRSAKAVHKRSHGEALELARVAKAEAEARIAQMRQRRMEGLLLDKTDVCGAFDELQTAARNGILYVAWRTAPAVADLTGADTEKVFRIHQKAYVEAIRDIDRMGPDDMLETIKARNRKFAEFQDYQRELLRQEEEKLGVGTNDKHEEDKPTKAEQ
jgi:hypothetical protein